MARTLKQKRGSKVDQTGRSKSDGKHVRIYEWEFACPAYEGLSSHATRLLLEFRRRYNGRDNRIHLSVRKAARVIHASKSTASRAIKELLERGFIRLLRKGMFSVREGPRDASVYALTNVPINGIAPKDYMHWRPRDQKSSEGSGKSCGR
ncbi:MAG: hypothetical protein KatS3mg119_0023 [Rhodothalassiaceae bacterium]|nr:MAG: hypothetical protein KatS3mg119_0023 [Rhodothalassiaceae bacterium]